jgi:hypothetical protein
MIKRRNLLKGAGLAAAGGITTVADVKGSEAAAQALLAQGQAR